MFLVILSAGLGILSFSPFSFSYIFGFVFLVPIFIFLFKEEKFWRLIWGVFVFKIILATATLYFAFDPYGFLLSVFVFLGLPIAVFIIKHPPLFKKEFSFLRNLRRRAGMVSERSEDERADLPAEASAQAGEQASPGRWPGRSGLREKKILFVLPFLWIFFENLQARYTFLPVFIGATGNIFGHSPFLGLAAFGGLNTLSFFAILVNILIAFIIFNFKKSSYKLNLTVIIIIIVIVLVGWQISQIKLQQNFDFYSNQPRILKIGLVSNNEKFDEEFLIFKNDTFTESEKKLAKSMVDEKLNLLKTDLINKKIDFLILPEEMIDIEIWNDTDKEAQEKFGISNDGLLIRSYADLAKELNAYLAATLTTIRDNRRYNTTVLFNREGKLVDIYDKSHLTIGGEYWPFGQWRPFYYDWLRKTTPTLDSESAIYNEVYRYTPGKRKLLKNENLSFASLICVEIHYPNEVKEFKNLGGQFISHTSSNRWISLGLKNYLYLTDNLRKIEAVWLKTPILINGRYEKAGIITPGGKIEAVNFENSAKDYGLFTGDVLY